jgi:hypothetical protein
MIFSDQELDGNQFVCFAANKPALYGISKTWHRLSDNAGGMREASHVQRSGSKYKTRSFAG